MPQGAVAEAVKEGGVHQASPDAYLRIAGEKLHILPLRPPCEEAVGQQHLPGTAFQKLPVFPEEGGIGVLKGADFLPRKEPPPIPRGEVGQQEEVHLPPLVPKGDPAQLPLGDGRHIQASRPVEGGGEAEALGTVVVAGDAEHRQGEPPRQLPQKPVAEGHRVAAGYRPVVQVPGDENGVVPLRLQVPQQSPAPVLLVGKQAIFAKASAKVQVGKMKKAHPRRPPFRTKRFSLILRPFTREVKGGPGV